MDAMVADSAQIGLIVRHSYTKITVASELVSDGRSA